MKKGYRFRYPQLHTLMSCKYTKTNEIFYKLDRILYDAKILQPPEGNVGILLCGAMSHKLKVIVNFQPLLQCNLWMSCDERGEYKHNDALISSIAEGTRLPSTKVNHHALLHPHEWFRLSSCHKGILCDGRCCNQK